MPEQYSPERSRLDAVFGSWVLSGDRDAPDSCRIELRSSGNGAAFTFPDVTVTWESGDWIATGESMGRTYRGTGDSLWAAMLALLAHRLGLEASARIHWEDNDA